ncbi:unnamed protein product [Agarophyton chilense]
MGKKSNRPLLRGPISLEEDAENSHRDKPDFDENDEVDEFFEDRHQAMLKDVGSDGSEAEGEPEPELLGTEVMKVHSSESEDSEDSGEEDENIPGPPEEEKKGWGARRKDWYGGDTHEFEIMEDDEREEALQDEEEEALRMQRKALEGLRPEDLRDEDYSDTEPEKEGSDVGSKSIELPAASGDSGAEMMDMAAPEVPALVKEMLQSHKAVQALQMKAKSNETLRVLYHLNASFVNNVAYYLSLRTDPEIQGIVNVRAHPVLLRILSIRQLLQKAKTFSIPTAVEDKSDELKTSESGSRNEYAIDSKKEMNSKSEKEEEHTLRKGEGLEPTPADAQNGKMNGVLVKSKKKTKKRRGKKRKSAELSIHEDEENVQELLTTKHSGAQANEGGEKRSKKKKKLRNVVNVMESQRKNQESKRFASTDEDLVRQEQKKVQGSSNAAKTVDGPGTVLQSDDDDEVMQKMLAKKAKKVAKKERKAAAAQPHVYRFKDKTTPDGKRKASSEVVRNKGLTRYRPRNKKTPRTKNRLAYDKAVKRRKGAVREYVGKPGVSYSGEASGINMSARKGSKLSEV